MIPTFVFLLLVSVFPSGWTQFRCPQPNGYFPHARQCDSYYECKNGVATEHLCPDGLMFNDRAETSRLHCELPFDVDCRVRPQVQPAQSAGNCPHLWGLYPNSRDCGRFWHCVDGFAHEFRCPEGLAYNDLTARCDWPDQVDSCESEAILDFSCPKATEYELLNFGLLRYPHPGDCRKFFACVRTETDEYKPRLLSCDPPNVFNYASNTCDWAGNVTGCENYYGGSLPSLDLRPVARREDVISLDFRRKEVLRKVR